jgi:hypothetical protein
MSLITTNINLAALQHVVMKKKSQSGEEIECLVIPIDKNHLYRGEKGGLYLSLVGFDLKEKTDKRTHMVKQSFPKEYLEKLTPEEKQAMPIFGNHNAQHYATEVQLATAINESDDLPF